MKAIRGEMGWSSSKEKGVKAILNFKVRMELIDNSRWMKKGKWRRRSVRGQTLWESHKRI